MSDVNKIVNFPRCDVCGAGLNGVTYLCNITAMNVGECCISEFRYAGTILNKAVRNTLEENMDCGTGGYRHPQPGEFKK